MTAAVALTGLAALIAGRLRQGLRLLLQQLVQGFLHAAADQFLDLPLDNFLIQLYNFLGHSLLSPFECLCGNFILPEPASYVFFYAVFNLRKLLYIIFTIFCILRKTSSTKMIVPPSLVPRIPFWQKNNAHIFCERYCCHIDFRYKMRHREERFFYCPRSRSSWQRA